jgi:hypothetical protein
VPSDRSRLVALPPRRLGSVNRRAVSFASESLVQFNLLPTGDLPLLVEPAGQGVDLLAWAASHRELLAEKLLRHW